MSTYHLTQRFRAWVGLLLVALIVPLLGCAATVRAEAARSDTELEAAAREYGGIVTWLADPQREGRGPGTKGIEQARDYLAARFKAIGLQPAVGDSYLEPFEIKLGVEAKDQSLAVVSGDGKGAGTFKGGQDFNALGFSASGKFEGEAVFIGYGVENKDQKYSSFGNDPDAIRGKVAFALRYEPQDSQGRSLWTQGEKQPGRWTGAANLTTKAKWAADHGAAALLLVNPPSQADGVLRSTSRTAFGSDARIPVMHIRPAVFQQILHRAGRDDPNALAKLQKLADDGKDSPDVLKGVTIRGNVDLDRPKTMIANVVGKLPGAGALADQYLVIGAHYDHLGYGDVGSLDQGNHEIHPGADDNASGSAGVVMLAERFARMVLNANDSAVPSPRRSLIFVTFSGEERGLLGSRHMVTHLKELGIKSEQIVAMLNMDMIGRMRNDKLWVFGAGSGKGLAQHLKDALAGSGLKVDTNGGAMGASDHASFYMQKIPALHFFTGSHADYHRVSDTAEKIDSPDAIRVLDVLEKLILELWQQPDRIAFVADKAEAHGGFDPDSGNGAHLGILPDYDTLDGDQGCGVSGVSPGSPAEKAGLKSGDLIVQWNGKPMPNIRGLMQRLTEGKPGDDVKLKVKRGDKLVDLKVKLGHR